MDAPGNIAWAVTATALVLLMTPGVAFFYGGLVKAKSVVSMMMMSFGALGLVGVLWILYGANMSVVDGTWSFAGSSSQWSTVSRSNLKKADAMNYNENGAGHIFIYESGDGWGSMYAYECKGCSYGCVHNLRTASSAYKGIRRAGY